MAEIIKEYNGKVYYDIWQPRNENNEIIYGQNESIYDYINKYGTLTDYTAFIDIDEFIVIPNNNLKKFINKHPNTTKFILKQKKFQDRYCYIDNNVLKIDDTIANIDTTNWANKLIVKNKVVEHNINNNIHSINVIKGDTYNVPIDEGWFNHYNVNLKQIEWMKQNFNKDNFDFIKDDSMQKYKYNINNNNFFNQDKLKENININCLIR